MDSSVDDSGVADSTIADATQNHLIHPNTDLVYQGAFRPPAGHIRLNGMTWIPPTNTGTGTLIIVDHLAGQATEISIPTPRATTNYPDLDVATTVQNGTDITRCNQGMPDCCRADDDPFLCCSGATTGCREGLTSPRLYDVAYLPQQPGMNQAKLMYILRNYYSPIAEENTIGWSSLDFAATTAGNWHITDMDSSGVGSYIMQIEDQAWVSHANGRSLAVGRFRIYGTGTSYGPSMYLVAPWSECGGSPKDCESNPPPDGTALPNVKVLNYDAQEGSSLHYDRMLQYISRTDNYYNAAWINYGGKNAVVFSARKSERWLTGADSDRVTYGIPGPDEAERGYKGYHGPPYWGALLFYNPDDLQNPVNTWDPQPYVWFQDVGNRFNQYEPGATIQSQNCSGPIAVDNKNGKLYVVEGDVDMDRDVIHVYSISSGSSGADTTAPSDPSSPTKSSVSHASATISWQPSTDNNDGVAYEIWINDTPYFLTDETSIVHANYEYYIAPVKYDLQAWDRALNKSARVEVVVTSSDGGNEPIALFIPSEFSASTKYDSFWPVSYLPIGSSGVSYSMPPKIEGGTPPYTVSLESGSLPKGLAIDPASGTITGTPTETGDFFKFDLKVEDSNSNVYIRRCALPVRSADICDRDLDGFDSDRGSCGGTDTDDFNSSINPGNPTVATPVGISIQNGLLSWNMMTDSTIKAYKIYSGSQSGQLNNEKFVGYTDHFNVSGSVDSHFAVTALDYRGLESPLSQEAQR